MIFVHVIRAHLVHVHQLFEAHSLVAEKINRKYYIYDGEFIYFWNQEALCMNLHVYEIIIIE